MEEGTMALEIEPVERLYTVEEAAERLSVSRETIRRALQSGRLKGRKLLADSDRRVRQQTHWRISESAIQELLVKPR